MNTNNVIRREILCPSAPIIRESSDGSKSMTVELEVIRFNERRVLMASWCEKFYEVIEPGAVTKELLDGCDIKVNICHNRERILARSRNGVGSLSYEVTPECVKAVFDMPNTTDGNDMLELIDRGDISGCSFEALLDNRKHSTALAWEDSGEKDADGESILLRRIKRFEKVTAFTVAIDPAYETTNVTRREVQEAMGERFPLRPEKSPEGTAYIKQVREMREAASTILKQ